MYKYRRFGNCNKIIGRRYALNKSLSVYSVYSVYSVV